MKCAWKELLDILPAGIREALLESDRETIQELRLRINAPPEIVLPERHLWLNQKTTQEDLNYVINAASRYSPWCAATQKEGYLTAPGGHRIGICGKAICKNREFEGFQQVLSLCIRVNRDFTEIAGRLDSLAGSILIVGAPGWGKTTLLRDLIRRRANRETVCVADERGELFPEGFQRGKQMDILTGCPKPVGMEILLRTMGPDTIAVDEISSEQDSLALVHAANAGVHLLATAHAGSKEEFQRRLRYRPFWENETFDYLVFLRKDKTYYWERMNEGC